jgi:phosphopantothenoylcysteine decarboxylase
VIFGVSGSVASIKAKEIIEGLFSLDLNVVVIATKSSQHFLDLPEYSISGIKGKSILVQFTDQDEWTCWTKREDNVLHIELRKLASLLLIAPLSANTMGKLANGLCDNLLTCVARCWELKRFPFIVAPAMNTMMFEHPLTEI